MSRLPINEKMIISKYLNAQDFFNFTTNFNLTNFYFTTFNCIRINIDYIPSTYIIYKLCKQLILNHENLKNIIINIDLPSPEIDINNFNKIKSLHDEFVRIINKIVNPSNSTCNDLTKLSACASESSTLKISIKFNYNDIYINISLFNNSNAIDFIKNCLICKSLNIISTSYHDLITFDSYFKNHFKYNLIYESDNMDDIKQAFEDNFKNDNFKSNFYINIDENYYKFKSFDEIKNNCMYFDNTIIYSYYEFSKDRLEVIEQFPMIYEIMKLRKTINFDPLRDSCDYAIPLIQDINSLMFSRFDLSIGYIKNLNRILHLLKYGCIVNLKSIDIMNKLRCVNDIDSYEIRFTFNYKRYGKLYFKIRNVNDEILNRIKYFV